MNSGRYLFTVKNPCDYASAALNKLGYETISSGHWLHDLKVTLDEIPPFGIIINSINTARKRAFLKKEEEKRAANST
jgi:hypothetical protein